MAALPPPGWYRDGPGLRWWDGRAWGPVAPGGAVDSSDRTLSILSHGGLVAGGFILPLVLYCISDDDTRPETRWHSRQALNFQLTYILANVVGFVLFAVALVFATASTANDDVSVGVGIAFALVVVVMIATLIVNIVFSIIGAVRANAGVRWKYPLTIPFVRG